MVEHAVPMRTGAAAPLARREGRLWPPGRMPRVGLYVIAVLLGIVLMLPFYWAVIGSLKQTTEVRQIPLIWWPAIPQWLNYRDVWNVRFFPNWVWNSVFLTVVATTAR